MPQQAPAAPNAPALAPTQITVNGAPIASAYDMDQAFRAQRRVLGQQHGDIGTGGHSRRLGEHPRDYTRSA